MGPFMHTGLYVAQSWRDYLGQQPDKLPIARPTIALAAQAFRDEIVLLGLKARRPVSNHRVFERISQEVAAGLEFYGNRGWLEKPSGFFAQPPPLTEVAVRKVKDRRRSFYRIFFDSGFTPHPGEPGSQRWLSYTANNREYALLLRHPEPRPWLVCVHGTEMGRAPLDLAVFRAWKLHDELGLNIVRRHRGLRCTRHAGGRNYRGRTGCAKRQFQRGGTRCHLDQHSPVQQQVRTGRRPVQHRCW